MTYCLGILTRFGLIMAADSRTNAGVDYVSMAQKLFDFSLPGERIILICTAGNLSMTQTVLTRLRRDLRQPDRHSINTQTTMFDVADYLGNLTRQVVSEHRDRLKQDGIDPNCTFLVGGQIGNEAPELYMIYSQGNFLRATKETPYLQIGEIKYGKPILDRVIHFETTDLDEAAKCALLSFDSTMKSNISVGPPLNLVMYKADSLHIEYRRKFLRGDRYLEKIRKSWENSVKKAFKNLPSLDWDEAEVQPEDENWLDPSNIYTT